MEGLDIKCGSGAPRLTDFWEKEARTAITIPSQQIKAAWLRRSQLRHSVSSAAESLNVSLVHLLLLSSNFTL
jgi:hypothetical protein